MPNFLGFVSCQHLFQKLGNIYVEYFHVQRVYGHIMQNKKGSVEDVVEEYFEKSVMKSVTPS